MLPRWHIFLGAIFTALLWFFIPNISLIYLALVFLSSFLIDFDHYVASGLKTGRWKLGDSFEYHKKLVIQEKKEIAQGIRKKSDFHLFHTIEFHFLVGILSTIWSGFFFIFLGMIFHSLLDVISLLQGGAMHRREFLLTNWLRKKV
jgi:hypothetical protein